MSDPARRPPGAEPDRVAIDLPFEEAVRRALNKPIPPGGIPDRPKPGSHRILHFFEE